jgi:putative transposase
VIGQSRSSQRYAGRKAERDCRLAERMVRLSQENPRYGYRRVWALLRREGWPVNKKKRVHKGCGVRKVSKSLRSNARGGVFSWAGARTDARGGGPSTKTTSGATTSLWT